jgi:LPXTG-site transpeptidase (sortase) family protein
MTLYAYRKAAIKPKKQKLKKDSKYITLASILDNITYTISSKLARVKPISFSIPILFIISGLTILYSQVKPYASHFIETQISDSLNQEIISAIPESYEKIRSAYISDPGSSYFTNILNDKESREEALKYKGTFYLTIDKIDINNAPVRANVDSTKENVYQAALSEGLAHFMGTDLPLPERENHGNILVYGHSAAGDYAYRNPQDVVTSFTRLFKLNIGDEIKVNFEDEENTYVIKRIREVTPENVEVLNTTTPNTLTLMTCSPPGLSSKRLILIATQRH